MRNNADATQVMANFNALLTCLNNLPTATPVTPQGRLTLASTFPVMISNQTGKTVIYYTPYIGNQVPIYNGTIMVSTPFTELSNVTSNAGTGNAGPAAVVADTNYDLFVWNNAGTPTLTRGPTWTTGGGSGILRGTGAGSTELQRILGAWTNKYAITNGPAANLGTYVGTVRTDASAATVSWHVGAVATGSTPANLHVWNAYNRITVRGLVGESTANWNYTTATWRSARGSDGMRVSFVTGQLEDSFIGSYSAVVFNSAGNVNLGAAIGYDVTNQPFGRWMGYWGGTNQVTIGSDYTVQALGFHYLQAIEISGVGGTTTWYGAQSSGTAQSGLIYQGQF